MARSIRVPEPDLQADFAESLSEIRQLYLQDALLETVAGLREGQISSSLLDDLTLLTLGAQLRGGANVQRGAVGIKQVFEVVEAIVADNAVETEPTRIRLENAAGRAVLVEFAPDPDIIIREAMSPENFRNIIAIEVKAGEDYSNIHNRIGEAEKGHQKARDRGYVECWTVYNVDGLDLEIARRESPTTNRFYKLDELLSGAGEEYEDFKSRLISLTGIPSA